MASDMKKADCRNIKSGAVYHGESRDRRMVECLYGDASDAIGEITPGCEIFGFTKGQFSMMDVIATVLRQTGPAKIDLSTWTAANADIKHAHQFIKDGNILGTRWVVDLSFRSRQKGYFKALVDRFGAESIRLTRTHAKFCTIYNDNWSIVIRSSMNLNKNPRFENFEISDDPKLLNFFVDLVDVIFTQPDVGHQPTVPELDAWFRDCEINGETYEEKKPLAGFEITSLVDESFKKLV